MYAVCKSIELDQNEEKKAANDKSHVGAKLYLNVTQLVENTNTILYCNVNLHAHHHNKKCARKWEQDRME